MDRLADQRRLMQGLNGQPGAVTKLAFTSGASASATLTKGRLYMCQPTADCWLAFGTGSATANGTDHVKVSADDKYYFMLDSYTDTVAALGVNGSGTARFWPLT